jgi:ABC-type oligopeptide transport system ATPase subunit
MTDAAPIVLVEGLRRTFLSGHGLSFSRHSVTAVDGVGFSVPRGTTFGIVGESGSGKSTTARILCGLERADAGSVVVDGHDVLHLPRGARLAFRRTLQLVFQDPYAALNPHWRIGHLVGEGMRVHATCAPRERRDRVVALLEKCGLPADVVDRFPHEFSGGQRQRICIARALAVEPKVLVLDEPVSALDVSIQAQILLLLQALQRELGLTYLFISHNLAVVEQLCDRIVVMRHGRIVETGATEDVIHRPEHEYTRALVASTPVPEPRRRRSDTAPQRGRTDP